jgi:hypothetical protein
MHIQTIVPVVIWPLDPPFGACSQPVQGYWTHSTVARAGRLGSLTRFTPLQENAHFGPLCRPVFGDPRGPHLAVARAARLGSLTRVAPLQENTHSDHRAGRYWVIGPTLAPHGCRSSGATWVIDPFRAAAGKRTFGPLCPPLFGYWSHHSEHFPSRY